MRISKKTKPRSEYVNPTLYSLDKIKTSKDTPKKFKGKEFKNLNMGEKDLLLETLCKMFGLLE